VFVGLEEDEVNHTVLRATLQTRPEQDDTSAKNERLLAAEVIASKGAER